MNKHVDKVQLRVAARYGRPHTLRTYQGFSYSVLQRLRDRLLVSYVVVWIVMLLVSRIDWRTSLRRTHRWYGVMSIATVYALGVIALVT